jgi:hypothetical protein
MRIRNTVINNYPVKALVVFVCNSVIYFFWFRLVKSNRKHKQPPPVGAVGAH